MGTVIFPDAPFKVFLTASAEERAERRYKQLKDKGVSVTLDGLLREILARDARDASRSVAPLRPADDAVLIDTTGVPIDEVVERVLAAGAAGAVRGAVPSPLPTPALGAPRPGPGAWPGGSRAGFLPTGRTQWPRGRQRVDGASAAVRVSNPRIFP
jgi:hypothetical protein